MPIFELYSTRNIDMKPDVYQYQLLSSKLRTQLTQIFGDAFGRHDISHRGIASKITPSGQMFSRAFSILSREYGENSLFMYQAGSYEWLCSYLLQEYRVERVLDLVEVLCNMLENEVANNQIAFEANSGATQKANDAIKEINDRMKRDGFGYEYIGGIIVRVDQGFIHSEVTKPALFLLSEFDGARNEFIKAHEHYRHLRFEECLIECNKSMESLLKSICDEQGWQYGKGTVNALIPICMANGLFPPYLQTHQSSLNSLITQGVPSIRNNDAGHGQGSSVREIPESLVSYALHLTATNIVFLSQCYKHLKKV